MNGFASRNQGALALLLMVVVMALGVRVVLQWRELTGVRGEIAMSGELAAEQDAGRARRVPPALLIAASPEAAAEQLGATIKQLGLEVGAVQPAGVTPAGPEVSLDRMTITASGPPAAVIRLSRWIGRNAASTAIDRLAMRAAQGDPSLSVVQIDLGVLVRAPKEKGP